MQFPSGQLCLFNFIISNRYGQLTATSLILVLFFGFKFYIMFVFQTIVLYIILVYTYLSCSGSLANQEVFSGFQGASARTCGSVGTCQSLTGAFFVRKGVGFMVTEETR